MNNSNTQAQLFIQAYNDLKPKGSKKLKGTIPERIKQVLSNDLLTVNQICDLSKVSLYDVFKCVFELKRIELYILKRKIENKEYYFLTTSKELFEKAINKKNI
jgi:hypothetical protein